MAVVRATPWTRVGSAPRAAAAAAPPTAAATRVGSTAAATGWPCTKRTRSARSSSALW